MKSIIITEQLIELVKTMKTKKNISGSDLSFKIGKKSNNYISLLENGRIEKIKIEDLRKLLNILLDLDGADLENFINNLNKSKDIIIIENNNDIDKKDEITEYIIDIDEKNFIALIDYIHLAFKTLFLKIKNKEHLLENVSRFSKNINFDFGFMIALVSIPFYTLKNTPFEKRQELLNEIAKLFKKYANEDVEESNQDISESFDEKISIK